MGLAYEIVINSDPCIAYLMEENTHADAGAGDGACLLRPQLASSRATTCSACGRMRRSIIDYLVYAKTYIAECEERHGIEAVEEMLDACHALMNYGVDRYRRPQKISTVEEEERAARTARPTCSSRSTTCGARCPSAPARRPRKRRQRFPGGAAGEPAVLHREERAAARTLAARDRAHRAQGGAVLLPAAPDAGDERGLGHLLALHAAQHHVRRGPSGRRLHDGDACSSHTNVVFQPPITHPGYSGINPYALGFAMFTDIAAHLREARPTRTGRGSPTSRAPTGSRRSTTRCATSRTRASSASTCRRS